VIKKIKNNDSVSHIWCGQEIQPTEYYQIQPSEESRWANDSTVLSDIGNSLALVNDGSSDITNINDAINWLKSNVPVDVNATIETTPPFAEPLYRTKFQATADLVTVEPNSSETIDFLITDSFYVYGGEGFVKGAELGDFVSAEVYDKDSIIPAPYRSALCEAWPCVNKYVLKMWINPDGKMEINTYPLIAKLSAGLYLRLTYTACADGSDRQVAVNYFLTKKL
jgi:hypothetical protein